MQYYILFFKCFFYVFAALVVIVGLIFVFNKKKIKQNVKHNFYIVTGKDIFPILTYKKDKRESAKAGKVNSKIIEELKLFEGLNGLEEGNNIIIQKEIDYDDKPRW